jgi:glycosyltransferase involved in cell wall biosynthesis
MKLLVAIPALNEEQSIREIISRCLAARSYIIDNSPISEVEITVVSDGSTDETVNRAREFESQIKLIVFPKNRGYGAAIMEAWNQSDADLLGFLDADGTCEPRFFANLSRTLVERRADVILGCRINPQSKMPPVRRFGNFLYATLLSALSNKRVKDTASGMRVVRRSSLRSLYPLPTGLHFTPAMSSRAMLSDRIAITEIDMPYSEREGRSKLSVIKDGVRFLNVILSTAFLYRPGKILGPIALVALLTGAALMLMPTVFYMRNGRVEEWMIYRFLLAGLLGQLGVLFWGLSSIASRAVEVAIQEEIQFRARPAFSLIRTPIFWIAALVMLVAAATLVWPGVIQLYSTGHTDLHWSRFVVSSMLVFLIGLLSVFRIVDASLDQVLGRVKYLASGHA